MTAPKTYTIGNHCFTLNVQAESVLRSYHARVKAYLAPFEASLMDAFEARLIESLTDLQKKERLLSKKSIDKLISDLGSPKVETSSSSTQKGCYKIPSQKMLGGVAAGIGYRLGIDPVWIRLALVLVALAGTPYQITWLVILLYGILYAVLPNIDDQALFTPKRLYRAPQKRMIAGVASGMAHYFNTSLFWIRVLFVLSFLFALSGLFVYITLWILTPKGKTLEKPLQVKIVS